MYYSDRKQSGTKDPEGIDARGVPYRVLVVDDEEITRRLVTQMLRSVGYDVVGEAEDGFRALEMFKRLRPDVVTLDVQMPRMNGLITLKAMREFDSSAIVIMVTTVAEKDIVVDLIKEGAAGYIVKPVERLTLLEKVKAVRKPNATRYGGGTVLRSLREELADSGSGEPGPDAAGQEAKLVEDAVAADEPEGTEIMDPEDPGTPEEFEMPLNSDKSDRSEKRPRGDKAPD